ncbi:MAG TPA: Crp/Fnr family transcriptional regulator, partial [Albitalea sp.]
MSPEATALLEQALHPQRRVLRQGESVFRIGDPFTCLHIIHSGFFKLLHFAAGGRQQVIGLHFKGDWLGFDGIARGDHGCEAIAMDTGEVWSVRYDDLLHACVEHSALAVAMHRAMSDEMAGDRDAMKCLGTLSADARVA